MNIIFVGDLHLKCTSPISRLDDYPTAILNKLEFMTKLVDPNRCNTIVLLGDVFDSPLTSLQYLSTVINTFKRISDRGFTVYTIAGNHDLKNNRMDSLPGTALGILLATGSVKLAPRSLEIGKSVFKFYNYPEVIDKKSSDKYEVCVAHRYYNFGLGEDSLCENDVVSLNYDAMILGHYHAPCETKRIGNTDLYIPGSLSRNTSEVYNKTRIPRVLFFNSVTHKGVYLNVNCAPASSIFVSQIESNNQQTMTMNDLIKFIQTSYNSSDMNVRDYFNNLQIPYSCKEKISKYLDIVGA